MTPVCARARLRMVGLSLSEMCFTLILECFSGDCPTVNATSGCVPRCSLALQIYIHRTSLLLTDYTYEVSHALRPPPSTTYKTLTNFFPHFIQVEASLGRIDFD